MITRDRFQVKSNNKWKRVRNRVRIESANEHVAAREMLVFKILVTINKNQQIMYILDVNMIVSFEKALFQNTYFGISGPKSTS